MSDYQDRLRATEDRRIATEDRLHATEDRAEVASRQRQASQDRDEATEDRRLASEDRATAADRLAEAAVAMGDLSAGMARALVRNDHAEATRRRQFWAQMLLIAVATIVISFVVGWANTASTRAVGADAADRAQLSRDRAQCSTAIITNWLTQFGAFFQSATANPRLDRNAAEYRGVVDDMNAANDLMRRSEALCYGADRPARIETPPPPPLTIPAPTTATTKATTTKATPTTGPP